MERYCKSESEYSKKITLYLLLSIIITVIILCVTLVKVHLIKAETVEKDNATSTKVNYNTSHIVIDGDSLRILSGDNIHIRLPMASTTKIMTALVAIESGKLNDKVTITHDMVGVEGSSIYLKEGEILTIEELLYGLMLRSGNDSATAIAIGVGGSIDGFVNMMNEKVASLKLEDTHFINPHGLHDENHYTSSYDLAIIAANAMRNDKFREIVSTKSKVIGGDNSDKRYLVNKNKILSMYEFGNGIKTGFTKKAGRCLVSSAYKNGMQLISVVLNEPNMWQYSIDSMDNAFREFTNITIADKYKQIEQVEIKGTIYKICTHNTLKYPIKEEERNKLTYEIVVTSNKKNIRSGENIGKLLVYYDKHLIFEEKIYTM